jgi:hypothetical protein
MPLIGGLKQVAPVSGRPWPDVGRAARDWGALPGIGRPIMSQGWHRPNPFCCVLPLFCLLTATRLHASTLPPVAK